MDETTQKILALHETVAAVCPILGVALNSDGRWRIDFAPSATAQQIQAAQNAAASFDWNTERQKPQRIADRLPLPVKVLAALVRYAKHKELGTTPPVWVTNTLADANQYLTNAGIP